MTAVLAGIYIEEKKGRIGTGSTAREAFYRNFYLVRPCGNKVETLLLTDKLRPTGIKELLSPDRLDPTWRHEPRLDKYYKALDAKLGPPEDPEPAPAKSQPAQPASSASQENTQPAAAKKPAAKKPEEKKDGWWESGGLAGKKLY